MAPRYRLKNADFAVLFLQNVLQANKIIAKNKIIIRPTYPNSKMHVTRNTHIFLFGLKGPLCSHSVWLLLKWSTIGLGFDGAETNCRIAHILGTLLIISY